MEKNSIRYFQDIDLLALELQVAMGCTEPVALAYAASLAKETLNEEVIKIDAFVSANIVKNVKSVIVPNTNGGKGIDTAIAAGFSVGDCKKELEVLASVKEEEVSLIEEFKKRVPIRIQTINDGHVFDIGIKAYSNNHTSYVRIIDTHTNVCCVKYDDIDLKLPKKNCKTHVIENNEINEFKKTITIKEILDFANTVGIDDIKEILDKQIKYNMDIASEGINNNYGANIGKTLLLTYGDNVFIKARAYAAAGSDARMNGCEKPVVINSGSGNQGITASVPVIVYAKEKGYSLESLYRALVLSNLCTIHLKTGIGTLSAYCGVVSAGSSAGAGICYLDGGDFKAIAYTLINALAITSGIVCDGAKASCAAKISSAVDAGIMGYCMYKNGNHFHSGDGIVKKGLEHTIETVGLLARVGMSETDKEIIKLMLND